MYTLPASHHNVILYTSFNLPFRLASSYSSSNALPRMIVSVVQRVSALFTNDAYLLTDPLPAVFTLDRTLDHCIVRSPSICIPNGKERNGNGKKIDYFAQKCAVKSRSR